MPSSPADQLQPNLSDPEGRDVPTDQLAHRSRKSRRRHQLAVLLLSVLGFLGMQSSIEEPRGPGAVSDAPSSIPAADEGSRPSPVTEEGIWLSPRELAALPRSGQAWDELRRIAEADWGEPDLADKDSKHDTSTLAAALAYARTKDASYLRSVLKALDSVMGTEEGGRTLALGRNLPSYVIAADLVDLRQVDPVLEAEFRSWISDIRSKEFDGRSLISTHEERPNNWGTHAGAARIAIGAYLSDIPDLQRAAAVFRGYLGDRRAYRGFQFGHLDWQAYEGAPVGINRAGASRDGHLIDGALPEEMRRGGDLRWPPKDTGYAWEALQGATVQAELLHRQGYDTWSWEDRALLRAAEFLERLDGEVGDWWADGDDLWQPWLLNHAYGTDLPASSPTRPGKNMGFTDWSHAPTRAAISSRAPGG